MQPVEEGCGTLSHEEFCQAASIGWAHCHLFPEEEGGQSELPVTLRNLAEGLLDGPNHSLRLAVGCGVEWRGSYVLDNPHS